MKRSRGTDVLRLDGIEHTAHVVRIAWSVDDQRFNTTLRYPTVDLVALAGRIGRESLARVLLHIALFEINKGVSLRPARVELGTWGRFVTPSLANLWNEVVDRVWAQWRYVHDDPGYRGPRLRATTPAPSAGTALVRATQAERYLVFCGGGKDTLLALHLLAQSGVEHETFVYTSSVYGPATRQFAIIDRLLDRVGRPATHRQSVYDDFLDTPLAAFAGDPGVRQVTSAETPSSLFAALPIVLGHGFTGVVVAHERSANVGNLVWAATGEEVNHQWGKSFAAEQLLNAYIRRHLVADFDYFSILQPIHDPLIFAMLADLDPAALAATHSCNVRKPWCRRCAKCAYVWVNYKAWFSWDVVDAMFGHADMLADPRNQEHFRRLLGLAEHTPFECVGGVDETRLAFALAHRRGLRGGAMDLFESSVGLDNDWTARSRTYLTVHDEQHALPTSLADRTLALMRQGELAALGTLSTRVPQLVRG